jgi:hypothetical protein
VCQLDSAADLLYYNKSYVQDKKTKRRKKSDIMSQNKPFLNKADVEGIIERRLPEWERMLEKHNKNGFYIIVLSPIIIPNPFPYGRDFSPGEILHEFAFNEHKWGNSDYRNIARGKALLCRREKMDSGVVPKYKLVPGDCIYPGGVYRNGLIAATSGLPSARDVEISTQILNDCEAVSKENFEFWRDARPGEAFVC